MPLIRELDDGTPRDPSPAITRLLAEQRIFRAVQRLGFGFADASNLVEYDPDADTAYWSYNQKTGEERICIGPRVAALDIDGLEVILRHEILHRSMYHAFGERYTDAGLSNLTLDICINRLLYQAYPAAMRAASEALYPPASKVTAIALADCSAQPSKLEPKLAALWTRIWRERAGEGPTLSPSSLYYQLLRVGAGDKLPQSYLDSVNSPSVHPSRVMGDAIDRVLGDLQARLPRGSEMAGELSTFSVSPIAIGTDAVEAFITSIRVRTVVDAAVRPLTEHLSPYSRIQPYSLFPSRLGLVYRAMGLTDVSHLYWNRSIQPLGARMAIGIYVDISGSMVPYFPLVASLVGAIKEYPLRLRGFDHQLHELNVNDFSSGKIEGGGGTDFDVPLTDFTDASEILAGLLITDGDANVSREVGAHLRRSGKPLHVIYLREPRGAESPAFDALRPYARTWIELPPTALATA